MDSYDYTNALTKVIPSVAAAHKAKGGLMVLRPDSGDPVECILQVSHDMMYVNVDLRILV